MRDENPGHQNAPYLEDGLGEGVPSGRTVAWRFGWLTLLAIGLGAVTALLGGCVSPYKMPGTQDQFLVTKHTEVRSPFGTNGGFDILERCTGPTTVVLFYLDADFTDCRVVTPDESAVFHKASQGQGGQIVSGLMNAAALGGVAAAAGSAGNAVSNASTTVINTVPRGHHR